MKTTDETQGRGLSSSRSNIANAMQGRVPKLPEFPAPHNQQELANSHSPSELVIPSPTSALQQVPTSTSKSITKDKRSSV